MQITIQILLAITGATILTVIGLVIVELLTAAICSRSTNNQPQETTK
jgi:hypothetical protein